ncbi:Tn3 family transposase [Uniformispora flossi]|uniref:Tn3 family transposase n=1 Tax=Uniformispora flossi TaxID=3390723 RepID=UPI003C2B143A
MLTLHLLQSALVHVNTLLVQQVLAEPAWGKKLSDEDRRGLTALFWSNVNPYGTFRLDMNEHLDLGLTSAPPPHSGGRRRPRFIGGGAVVAGDVRSRAGVSVGRAVPPTYGTGRLDHQWA